jgi:hypothetical protein
VLHSNHSLFCSVISKHARCMPQLTLDRARVHRHHPLHFGVRRQHDPSSVRRKHREAVRHHGRLLCHCRCRCCVGVQGDACGGSDTSGAERSPVASAKHGPERNINEATGPRSLPDAWCRTRRRRAIGSVGSAARPRSDAPNLWQRRRRRRRRRNPRRF